MDNRTLDELKVDDDAQFGEIIKTCKTQHFISIDHARAFRAAMLTNCLKKLGIDATSVFDLTVDPHAAAARFDQLLVQNKVVIENRRQEQERPSWECGMYLFKAGELAYFISIIFPIEDTFTVKTNAPEDIV